MHANSADLKVSLRRLAHQALADNRAAVGFLRMNIVFLLVSGRCVFLPFFFNAREWYTALSLR